MRRYTSPSVMNTICWIPPAVSRGLRITDPLQCCLTASAGRLYPSAVATCFAQNSTVPFPVVTVATGLPRNSKGCTLDSVILDLLSI